MKFLNLVLLSATVLGTVSLHPNTASAQQKTERSDQRQEKRSDQRQEQPLNNSSFKTSKDSSGK